MGWRDILKAEGIPPEPIRNIRTIRTMSGISLAMVNSADTADSAYRTPTLTLPVATLRPAPRMTQDVARQLAADSEALLSHFQQRLYTRLSRVMRSGYLAWTQTHEPELWRQREAARLAWDTPEAYQAFKDCRTPWAEYKWRIHQWAIMELAAIRRHSESAGKIPHFEKLPDALLFR